MAISFCSCFRMNRILMGQGGGSKVRMNFPIPVPRPHSWPDLGWMESWSKLKDDYSHKHRKQKEDSPTN